MPYIWSVIRAEIMGKGLKQWHYKQCVDCGAWEDLSLSKHRSTWTTCEKCLVKRRIEQARLRQRKKRAKFQPTSDIEQ
jgi:hypothetical protein